MRFLALLHFLLTYSDKSFDPLWSSFYKPLITWLEVFLVKTTFLHILQNHELKKLAKILYCHCMISFSKSCWSRLVIGMKRVNYRDYCFLEMTIHFCCLDKLYESFDCLLISIPIQTIMRLFCTIKMSSQNSIGLQTKTSFGFATWLLAKKIFFFQMRILIDIKTTWF